MSSEHLETYVAFLFASDPVVTRLTKGILRMQKRLRGRVDERAWRTYLRLEALVNHRHGEILQKVGDHLAGRTRSRTSS